MAGLRRIRIGCCGFPVRRREYFLRFPVVEIQQTFYKLPRLKTVAGSNDAKTKGAMTKSGQLPPGVFGLTSDE